MENHPNPELRKTVACAVSSLLVVIGARCLRMGFKAWGGLESFELHALFGFLALYAVAFASIVSALAGPPSRLVEHLALKVATVNASLQRLPPAVRGGLKLFNTAGPAFAVIYFVGRRVWTRFGVDYFGTDGLLFAQYAVDSLFEGRNPYAMSMEAAFLRYASDESFGTYRIDGSLVAELSYPAMSVLAFVPQKLIGLPCFDLTSLVALMVVCVWLVVRSPLATKWATPGMLWTEWGLVSFTAGGVFDILWTLPVIATMAAFAKRRLYLAGFLFGVACSVKQTPWFIAPFIVLWLMLERGDYRTRIGNTLRFGGVAVAAFLIVNGPFMVADFDAWLRGVLVPVAGGAPLVELGAGPVMFNIAGLWHAPKAFYSLMMVTVLALVAIAYVFWFERLKWFAFCAPMVILWFNYRSLHNYYVYFLPVALMGVLLKYASHDAPLPQRWRRPGILFGACFVSACLVIFAAYARLSPRVALKAQAVITDKRDPGELGRISELDIQVTNEGATPIRPSFGIVHTGHQSPVHWRIDAGPSELGANSTGAYKISAPIGIASIPYDAAMHLRVYDSGSERRISIVTQRMDAKSIPALRNPTFQQWVLNADNGLRQPLLWTARPSLALPHGHTTMSFDDGAKIGVNGSHGVTGASRLLLSSLEQTIDRQVRSVSLVAEPEQVATDLETPQSTSGFELLGPGYCVRGIFTSQAQPHIAERTIGKRQCRVIGIPATPGIRVRHDVPIAELVGPEFFAHLFGPEAPTRIGLFAAVGSNDAGAQAMVTFHDVRAH